MKKHMKLMATVVTLVIMMSMLVGCAAFFKTATNPGGKQITVIVIHKNGNEKSFSYYTQEGYLDKVLRAEGLIEGYEDQYGFVIEKVDGEAAIWNTDNAFWAVYVGDTQSNYGISSIPVEDGATYKLVYESIS